MGLSHRKINCTNKPKKRKCTSQMNWNWIKRCIIPRNARVRGQPVGKRVKNPNVQKDPNIPGQCRKGPGRSGKGDATPVSWQSTMPSGVPGTPAEAYPRILRAGTRKCRAGNGRGPSNATKAVSTRPAGWHPLRLTVCYRGGCSRNLNVYIYIIIYGRFLK